MSDETTICCGCQQQEGERICSEAALWLIAGVKVVRLIAGVKAVRLIAGVKVVRLIAGVKVVRLTDSWCQGSMADLIML
jgi:hypothetical protein